MSKGFPENSSSEFSPSGALLRFRDLDETEFNVDATTATKKIN